MATFTVSRIAQPGGLMSWALQRRGDGAWYNFATRTWIKLPDPVSGGALPRPPLRPLPERSPGDYWEVVTEEIPDGDYRTVYYSPLIQGVALGQSFLLLIDGSDATPVLSADLPGTLTAALTWSKGLTA